jgi:CotS family spore coat protein
LKSTGGCFMDELNIQAVHAFGLKPKSIIKHKLFYILNTDSGVKVIKKIAPDSESARQSILFQQYIKENLCRQGYPFLDHFHLSVKNEPFVVLDKSLYSLTDHLPFRESNFAAPAEFKKVVANVAVMHALAKNIAPYNDSFPQSSKQSVDGLYQSSAGKLISLKKNIAKYKQLSDFDVLFYKNFSYYKEKLDQWHCLIRASNFEERDREAREKGEFCHNLLKEEYLLLNKEDVYITNFSDCAYGYSLTDLALLLKRHFKASTDRTADITDIIETYHKNNPLTKKDIEILYALLLFPDKFIKICSQYYAKKRTWIPGTFKSRIEQTVETKDAYMRYIDGIYEEFLK